MKYLLLLLIILSGCVNNADIGYVFDEETASEAIQSEDFSISSIDIFDKKEELSDTLLINPSKLAKVEIRNAQHKAYVVIAAYNTDNQNELTQLDSLKGAIPIQNVAFWKEVNVNDDIKLFRSINENMVMFAGLPDSLYALQKSVIDSFTN